jgi:dCMP deaminase
VTSSHPTSARKRLTWDEYFVNILSSVAGRTTCDRGRSGALLVYQHQIVATGYVGSPPGFPHCDDVGHEMVDGHCVRTVHAEQNAIASAAKQGIPTLGSTLYTTMTPCRVCAMLTITAGVDRVVATCTYPGDPHGRGVDILNQAGIEFKQLSGAAPSYGS